MWHFIYFFCNYFFSSSLSVPFIIAQFVAIFAFSTFIGLSMLHLSLIWRRIQVWELGGQEREREKKMHWYFPWIVGLNRFVWGKRATFLKFVSPKVESRKGGNWSLGNRNCAKLNWRPWPVVPVKSQRNMSTRVPFQCFAFLSFISQYGDSELLYKRSVDEMMNHYYGFDVYSPPDRVDLRVNTSIFVM